MSLFQTSKKLKLEDGFGDLQEALYQIVWIEQSFYGHTKMTLRRLKLKKSQKLSISLINII